MSPSCFTCINVFFVTILFDCFSHISEFISDLHITSDLPFECFTFKNFNMYFLHFLYVFAVEKICKSSNYENKINTENYTFLKEFLFCVYYIN